MARLRWVGAPYADGNEPGSGAAYIFRRGVRYIPGQDFVVVWEREAKLIAPGGKTGDLFGYSVSLESDLSLIGAPAAGSWEKEHLMFLGKMKVYG